MINESEELLKEIEGQIEVFKENSQKYIEKGNAQAAKRSRKASLDLTKLLKEWRKVSMK